jgi:hypothetical protein
MTHTAGSERISRIVSTARFLSQLSAAKNANTSPRTFFGGENRAGQKKIVKPLDFLEVQIRRIGQGDPVKRAGKDGPHGVPLGAP